MKLIPFGRTDRLISNLCLNTANFGWNTDARTSHAILDTFVSQGGNFLLAASNADSPTSARSQAHVGSWIARRAIVRDELMLAAKMVIRSDTAINPWALAHVVHRCCVESLRRLRVEYLDVLLCEIRSPAVSVPALLDALEHLRAEGLVRHFGVSRWPIGRVREASRVAELGGAQHLAVLEDDYSLVAPTHFETWIAPECRKLGAAFLASSPLAGGFLDETASSSRGWVSVGDRMALGPRSTRSTRLGTRDLIEQFAGARGRSIAEIAIAWVLANPDVSAAVVGATSPHELQPLLAAAHAPLSADEAAELSALRNHGTNLNPHKQYTEIGS